MHLLKQRILVFPQLIDSPLKLQPILAIHTGLATANSDMHMNCHHH